MLSTRACDPPLPGAGERLMLPPLSVMVARPSGPAQGYHFVVSICVAAARSTWALAASQCGRSPAGGTVAGVVCGAYCRTNPSVVDLSRAFPPVQPANVAFPAGWRAGARPSRGPPGGIGG